MISSLDQRSNTPPLNYKQKFLTRGGRCLPCKVKWLLCCCRNPKLYVPKELSGESPTAGDNYNNKYNGPWGKVKVNTLIP